MEPVDLAALVKETAQNMTMNARRAYKRCNMTPSPPPCAAAATS